MFVVRLPPAARLGGLFGHGAPATAPGTATVRFRIGHAVVVDVVAWPAVVVVVVVVLVLQVVLLIVVVVCARTVVNGGGGFVLAATTPRSSPTTTARENNVRRSGITRTFIYSVHYTANLPRLYYMHILCTSLYIIVFRSYVCTHIYIYIFATEPLQRIKK